jgi:hypothetical protein
MRGYARWESSLRYPLEGDIIDVSRSVVLTDPAWCPGAGTVEKAMSWLPKPDRWATTRCKTLEGVVRAHRRVTYRQ